MAVMGWMRGLKKNFVFCALSLWVYLYVKRAYPSCPAALHYCGDGRIMRRLGPTCQPDCVLHPDPKLQTRVIWNAPLHSWSGTASEAMDFIVPLVAELPHLGLVGGYSADYVKEHSLHDIEAVAKAREYTDECLQEIESAELSAAAPDAAGGGDGTAVGAGIYHHHGPGPGDTDPAPPGAAQRGPSVQYRSHRSLSTVLVTQYDPGTYEADLHRHQHHNFDFTIGRAMFETTGIPAGWAEATALVDELWVPSHWGKQRFVTSGVEPSKIKVIPEAVNLGAFNPRHVKKDETLLPGSKGTFSFLSVFKWERRKNYATLLMAFLQEFDESEDVTLYVRSGDRQGHLANFLSSTIFPRLNMWTTTRVKWVPQIPEEHYPKLFATADAFILPTHGEGWCRPVMEAMAMGMPVITTHWGGLTDLVTDNTALLLRPTGLEPAFEDQPELINYDDQANHLWASVATDDVQKVMRYASNPSNTAIIREIGNRARARITKHFSREVVAGLVVDRLRQIQGLISERANNASHSNPP